MAFPFLAFFGAVQAGASIASGITGIRASRRQADILEQEAERQREQGEIAQRNLFERAQQIGIAGEATLARNRASYVKRGVSLTEGSPLAVMREAEKSIQTGISRTRSQGRRALQLGLSQAEVTGQRADTTRRFGFQTGLAQAIGGGISFLGDLASRNIYQDIWNKGQPIQQHTDPLQQHTDPL